MYSNRKIRIKLNNDLFTEEISNKVHNKILRISSKDGALFFQRKFGKINNSYFIYWHRVYRSYRGIDLSYLAGNISIPWIENYIPDRCGYIWNLDKNLIKVV